MLRKGIIGFLILVGVIISVVAGGWHLFKPGENEGLVLAPDFSLTGLGGEFPFK